MRGFEGGFERVLGFWSKVEGQGTDCERSERLWRVWDWFWWSEIFSGVEKVTLADVQLGFCSFDQKAPNFSS